MEHNMENTITETTEDKVELPEETPVIEAVENPKLDKAYLLFAEFHGTQDEQYTQEDRIRKLKELKAELDSVIGYEDDEMLSIKSSLETKTKEYDDLSSKLSEANQKIQVQTEELRVLTKLAKEFKTAKTGPLANESPAMVEKTPQEIYDELLITNPAKASEYANRIRFGR